MDHLTHGWEPELADSDTLLRRFVLASAHRSVDLAIRGGGRGELRPAISLADPASPVMFDNIAVLLQPPAYIDLDATMEELVAFYPPERHVMLLSAWPTPDLSQHGFSLMGHPPLMYRAPGGQAPPRPDGLEIRAVEDQAALEEFVTTLVEAYPMPGADRTVLRNPALLDAAVRLFVGYVDDRPVGTSGARLGHGLVDVEWVSARAEVRGRGIGAALTWAATMVEPDLPAALIASDDGQPVYERMGYLRLLRLTAWHRPPTSSPTASSTSSPTS